MSTEVLIILALVICVLLYMAYRAGYKLGQRAASKKSKINIEEFKDRIFKMEEVLSRYVKTTTEGSHASEKDNLEKEKRLEDILHELEGSVKRNFFSSKKQHEKLAILTNLVRKFSLQNLSLHQQYLKKCREVEALIIEKHRLETQDLHNTYSLLSNALDIQEFKENVKENIGELKQLAPPDNPSGAIEK